jgi:hypothetical protein
MSAAPDGSSGNADDGKAHIRSDLHVCAFCGMTQFCARVCCGVLCVQSNGSSDSS